MMFKRASYVLLPYSLLLLPSLSVAITAQQAVQNMSMAFKKLDYQGVFIHSYGDQLSSFKIYHDVENGIERERLMHLDGVKQEVLRLGDEVSCIYPQGQEPSEAVNGALTFHRDFSELKGQYSVQRVSGSYRVAGLTADKIVIAPNDPYRFGYKLWLESENQFLLKSELVDENGKALERFQFTWVDIGGELPDDVFSMADGASVKHSVKVDDVKIKAPSDDITAALAPKTSQAPATVSHLLWDVDWVPEGFYKANDRPKSSSDKTRMYSDGLSAFTVFVEDMAGANMAEGVTRIGATSAAVKRVTTSNGVRYVTVLGEVPFATVEKVAASVKFLDQPASPATN